MAAIEQLAGLQAEMTAWRRHLHTHPETAFEEHETSAFVAERLANFGIDVHRGLAGTGIVGTLSVGEGPAIGLRADMDALPLEEVAGAEQHRRVPVMAAGVHLAGPGRAMREIVPFGAWAIRMITMSSELAGETCTPCRGGIPPMVLDEAKLYLEQTPRWTLLSEGTRIERTFKFANFKEALEFVDQIGALAEAEGHHPDIRFGWGYCTVELYTHKIKGLHQNDFIMAAKIDELARTTGAPA